MAKDYSNITQAEINLMPFWKRLCFECMGWNHAFDPNNIDEWHDMFSIFGINEHDVKLIRKAVELHEEDH